MSDLEELPSFDDDPESDAEQEVVEKPYESTKDFEDEQDVTRFRIPEPTVRPTSPPPSLQVKNHQSILKSQGRQLGQQAPVLKDLQKNLVNTMNEVIRNFDFVEDGMTAKEMYEKALDHTRFDEYVQSADLLVKGYGRFLQNAERNQSLMRELVVQLREIILAVHTLYAIRDVVKDTLQKDNEARE